MEEKAKHIAELLKILANESRLLIFCSLMERPMTVSELSKRVPNITQPALSQHLMLLKAHNILDNAKSGQTVTYYIVDRRVEEIIHTLKKYYCIEEDATIA
ncbi:MAG: metalloregulator ArsR/SmtB family transcription factor [Clostridiales bacterium]|nr:metalloregulator ArsR/SmtB family transcription factor [Clostridiales bacterium]